VPGAWVALACLASALTGPADALTIDPRSLPAVGALGDVQQAEAVQRVTGRVLTTASARDPDGVLRTAVTVGDGAGRAIATFVVTGGREGGVMWVADGVPLFDVGERIQVALVPNAGGAGANAAIGLRLADDPEALTRLEPAPSGASGERWSAAAEADGPIPSVLTVDPPLGGASPGASTDVVVEGTGFGAEQGESRVTFQGLFERVDAPVVSWSDTRIVCRVPAPGVRGTPQVLSGPIKVWTAAGGWSEGSEFVGGPRFRVTYQWAGDSYSAPRLPIAVYLSPEGFPGGAAAGELIRQAAEAWNTPGSFARLEYRGLTNADAGNHGDDLTRRDGRNTVRWRQVWPHPSGWIAVTWSAIDTLTYERLETEMEMNGERKWTLDPESDPDGLDLVTTLVHEFGHWLRLGHTQNVASVMTGFQVPGVLRRQISPADSYGASYIYPTFGEIVAPSEVPSATPIGVPIRALDREGNPLSLLPGSEITVRAVPLAGRLGGTAIPSPLAPAVGGGVAPVNPVLPTDGDGWTQAILPLLDDGAYRIEATVRGEFVRPAPSVVVGTPAAPAAPAFSFTGLSPQPLRAGTRGTVRFSLPASSHLRLDLYDARGRHVRAVANERFESGPHELALWTTDERGATLTSGVYFLRLSNVAGWAFTPRTSRLVVLP
jgi:hypothetical protein